MKNHLWIVSNSSNKSLSLALPNNIPEGDVIGPYMAMYKYTYEKYTWTNWSEWYNKSINLGNVKGGTAKHAIEDYVNSVIISASADTYSILDIAEELMYMPNYIYVLESGKIELIEIEHVDYECGKGDYFYDKGNFKGDIKPDLIYEGEYLRCIFDKSNNIKSGHVNLEEQEILIPFNIKLQ